MDSLTSSTFQRLQSYGLPLKIQVRGPEVNMFGRSVGGWAERNLTLLPGVEFTESGFKGPPSSVIIHPGMDCAGIDVREIEVVLD